MLFRSGVTASKERTLLIADDDAAFRNRIARALELRGFIVTSVGSVAEALAQTARPPAFAVLDLRLGDGNGLELVGPLRQARPDIRIVVLTGYASIATAVEAIKLGACHYLAKPANTDDIEAAFARRRSGSIASRTTSCRPRRAPLRLAISRPLNSRSRDEAAHLPDQRPAPGLGVRLRRRGARHA